MGRNQEAALLTWSSSAAGGSAAQTVLSWLSRSCTRKLAAHLAVQCIRSVEGFSAQLNGTQRTASGLQSTVRSGRSGTKYTVEPLIRCPPQWGSSPHWGTGTTAVAARVRWRGLWGTGQRERQKGQQSACRVAHQSHSKQRCSHSKAWCSGRSFCGNGTLQNVQARTAAKHSCTVRPQRQCSLADSFAVDSSAESANAAAVQPAVTHS
jgi:hypothetical protein